MKAHEIRGIAREELPGKITEWEEELFRARCNASIGQLDNPNELRFLRRQIARAKTILNETDDVPVQQ